MIQGSILKNWQLNQNSIIVEGKEDKDKDVGTNYNARKEKREVFI